MACLLWCNVKYTATVKGRTKMSNRANRISTELQESSEKQVDCVVNNPHKFKMQDTTGLISETLNKTEKMGVCDISRQQETKEAITSRDM